MISLLAPLLSGSLLAVPSVDAAACEFGEVHQGQPVKCLVEFVNRGDSDVRVASIAPMYPSDKVDVDRLLIPARGTARITVHIDTTVDVGLVHHLVRYRLPGDKVDRHVDSKGFVANVYDIAQTKFAAGVVALTDTARKPGVLTLSSDEDPTVRLTSVIKASPYLDVRINEDGRGVSFGVRDSAPWGMLDEYVVLGVDNARQKQVAISVKGDIRGQVVPGSNPLNMDLIRRGSGKHEFIVPLEDTSGKKLKVGSIKFDRIEGRARSEECVPARKECRWLRIEVSDKQPNGKIDGAVRVELPDYGRTLPILAWGLMINADTVVRDFDEAKKPSATPAPDQGGASAVSPVAAKSGNLVEQLKRATKSASTIAGDPPGSGPVLRWQVANEGTLYGYHIYRAATADGPWKRVNGETIRVVTEDNAGGSYSWRDQSAVPGEHYWYYIGTIDFRGKRERLTTPSEVVVKAAQ